MRRPAVPRFLSELLVEPVARIGLVVGAVALAAAALDPRVWGPALPTVQAATRERPNLEALAMLGAVGSAGLLLVGGALGDSTRAHTTVVAGPALVATSYRGIPRATAIGLAYGAYGAAGAAAPVLLQIVPGERAPAMLVAIAASGLALWVVRRRIPDLPRASTAERPYVAGLALWAFGFIAVTVGLSWLGGLDNPLRWGLVLGGAVIVILAAAQDRRRA